MQTILGAGGAIGSDLAGILSGYTERMRLVSRHPGTGSGSGEVVAADLLDAAATRRAVAGSDVVYLVAGLPYKASVWREQWPVVMQNTIDACRKHGARLVFFDNMYMYDREYLGSMDENTPVRPTTAKGAVRAAIAQSLLDAHAAGDIQALIARSADFYGPGRQANSVLTQTVFERLAKGRAARWLLSADHEHSFTYTPDAARGTAMLGNAEDTWGEVWHLPTASHPPTGREWIGMIAAELGVEPGVQVIGDLALRGLGLFVPALREIREMAYQYDRDYDFDSGKFSARFGFEPTPYRDGIGAVVAADYA